MSDVSLNRLPDGPNIRGKLSRDDVLMRMGMVVIALYLAVLAHHLNTKITLALTSVFKALRPISVKTLQSKNWMVLTTRLSTAQ